MYEKILIPLDGSELAEVALPYAEELAGRLGSEAILIYVSEPTERTHQQIYRSYMQKMLEATLHAAEGKLEKLGGKAIKVESVILEGNPAEEIVEYAHKEDINLIIMATHGRSGLRRWSLGSVANKVLRATKRPVLLIRAKDSRPDVREKGMLNKALVPLDGSKESEAVIPYIEELASKLKAEVILVQVLQADWFIDGIDQAKQLEAFRTSGKDYIEKIAAKFNQIGVAVKTEFREQRKPTVAEEIVNLADELHVDLVAMSTHGRSGISRWAFGSVADKVLHAGNTPLLLVRTPGASTE